MIYVKATLVGVLCAVLAPIAWGALQIAFVGLADTVTSPGKGSGGVGAVAIGMSEIEGLLAMAIGFAVGFGWMIRRGRRRLA